MLIALFRVLSWLPLACLQAIGGIGGCLAWMGAPALRRRARANAALAGYGDPAIARRAMREAGKAAAELPFLWMRGAAAVRRVRCDDWHVVESAWATGRGIVFLTPHLGCFEVTAQYYASRRPITVLYRPPRKAWLLPLVESARGRANLETAPASLAGVRQLLRALRTGEAVGILPDQVPSAGEGAWAPFFGRSAYTMTLPMKLARTTGATLILAFAERLPWGRGYRLHLAPYRGVVPEEGVSQARAINAAMEELVRRCPQQYLWSYNRYKQPAGVAEVQQ